MEEQGKKTYEVLHESLQEMIGLHSQLLEVVKMENEAITQADIKNTFEAAASKEALVHWIQNAEINRQAIVYTLSTELNLVNPSLREIILHYQVMNAEISAKLQTDLGALMVLVERIQAQNGQNKKLVEHSLLHVNNMRKNIFGEAGDEGKTYNQQGQKNQYSTGTAPPRMISKEV